MRCRAPHRSVGRGSRLIRCAFAPYFAIREESSEDFERQLAPVKVVQLKGLWVHSTGRWFAGCFRAHFCGRAVGPRKASRTGRRSVTSRRRTGGLTRRPRKPSGSVAEVFSGHHIDGFLAVYGDNPFLFIGPGGERGTTYVLICDYPVVLAPEFDSWDAGVTAIARDTVRRVWSGKLGPSSWWPYHCGRPVAGTKKGAISRLTLFVGTFLLADSFPCSMQG